MTSSIDDTKPTASTALTADVRSNFSHAEDEINSLLHMSEDSVTCTGTADAMTAAFSIQPVLADTPRILVTAPASTSTVTTPSITVNDTLSSGAKTIVNKDGSALVVGDITSGIVMDLVYDGTSWVWMNGNDLQAALDTAEADIATLQAVASYPPNHLDGMAFAITTDVSSNDSFQVAVGTARTTTYDVDLTSALDKDITETWAEGDGNGGVNDTLFGSMAANTKYYVFAITQSDGSVDFIIDDNISGTGVLGDTAVTAAGYTELVHVGYARTGSSATALRNAWRKSHAASPEKIIDKWSASADANILFDSDIDSTYNRYRVRFNNLVPATNSQDVYIRSGVGSADSGGSDYNNQGLKVANGSSGAITALSTAIEMFDSASIDNTAANGGVSGFIDIISPSNASVYTQFSYEVQATTTSTSGVFYGAGRGVRTAAQADDLVQLLMSSGNITSGEFELIGLE